ncbi:hypothetical protein B5X24_HaOG203250 [Helicoverpa armigera]|uniref:WD repeat-containing protein 55 homolog n=1 Tax=Helicoverpa armigera TaxID=29058 RepID=A0A2W1BWF4_HELAM|nr:hypothetical protein B5X24_HaOG203250 [Helicoverpa armigera]
MVFRTNWLLVVKARRPCSLMLLDDQQRAFKAEVLFKSPIRALRARKDKVAVVLSSSIQVLALPSLSRVALMRTRLGARPLCALASEPSAPHLLAAPAHRKGSLQLLDVTRAVKGAHSSSPAVMGCHQTELVCLSLSANGARLATASERGTIIRVWDTATKQMLHELRRGSDYADVYCVDTRALCAFTDDNTAVLICEDGTFHKFTFAAEGNCHRSDFEYFLQVGDDDEFLQ